MVHSAVHSEFVSLGFSRKCRASFPHNIIYQVVIDGEDGEYAEYEIEADSEEEASVIAQELAAENMIDIVYIQVYLYR